MIKNKTNENLMEIITNYIYIYIFNDKIYDKRYVGAIWIFGKLLRIKSTARVDGNVSLIFRWERKLCLAC